MQTNLNAIFLFYTMIKNNSGSLLQSFTIHVFDIMTSLSFTEK